MTSDTYCAVGFLKVFRNRAKNLREIFELMGGSNLHGLDFAILAGDDRIEELERESMYWEDERNTWMHTAEDRGVRIRRAEAIKQVHPSWGAGDEYKQGWKDCRELFRDMLELDDD